jgi:hypothetical protein
VILLTELGPMSVNSSMRSASVRGTVAAVERAPQLDRGLQMPGLG